MNVYKEWAEKSEKLWKERARKFNEDQARLLAVARAAQDVVEQDKEQFDRLIVVLALEEALAAVEDLL